MHTENDDAPLKHPRTSQPATSWFASATPPTTPIVGGIGSGKSAAIDGPARDNVRHHAALTSVSPDDALMTFVSPDDGFADLYPTTETGEQ